MPIKKTVCFLLIIFTINGWAQESLSDPTELEFQKAKSVFNQKKYNTAAGLFKKIYPKVQNEEKKDEVLFWIAESYRLSNNFKQAYNWYEQLVNTKYPDPKILYSYGLLLKNYERYEDALRQFNDYLFEVPGDKNALREVEACKMAIEWKLNPKKFLIQNQKNINTAVSDYSPFISDGKLTWSSSRNESTGNVIFEWTGQKCADIFETTLQIDKLGSAIKVPGLVNSNYNEGVAWVDNQNTTMFFTQCNGSDGKGMNCKIYVSYFQNKAWSLPVALPFCSDSFSVGHPAVTPDLKRMYFASNMPGSYGEKDIYTVDYNPLTSVWGKPVNLGSVVNTVEDDMFPSIHPDGSLYFASKGHLGMGGLDLFRTIDSAGGYIKPINLQAPINSGGDDFGITFNPGNQNQEKPIAYFSSNREGGEGDDDIYAIKTKPYTFMVKVNVVDKETLQPISGADVSVVGSLQNNLIKTDVKGNMAFEVMLNQQIKLTANAKNYFRSEEFAISSLNLTQDSVFNLSIRLEPIPDAGVEFTLRGIYYDLDKSDIRPEAAKILDSLVIILNNNPNIIIELASHTDSRADEDYNLKLSQRRAQSCVDYLSKKGINKTRMKAVGYGESKLINDCADGVDCSEEQHQENRRTTFSVIGTDFKQK